MNFAQYNSSYVLYADFKGFFVHFSLIPRDIFPLPTFSHARKLETIEQRFGTQLALLLPIMESAKH